MRSPYRKVRPVRVIDRSMFSWNFVFIVLLITLFALGYLKERSSVRTMLLHISQMERQVDDIIQENKYLQARLYNLSNNDRIRKIAMEKLHMVEPKQPAKIVFYLDKEHPDSSGEVISEMLQSAEIAYQNPNSLVHMSGE